MAVIIDIFYDGAPFTDTHIKCVWCKEEFSKSHPRRVLSSYCGNPDCADSQVQARAEYKKIYGKYRDLNWWKRLQFRRKLKIPMGEMDWILKSLVDRSWSIVSTRFFDEKYRDRRDISEYF